MAPIISHLLKLGLVEARAEHQLGTFQAGVTFARNEGIISAPETNHAIELLLMKRLNAKKLESQRLYYWLIVGTVIWIWLLMRLTLPGKLKDYAYPQEKIEEALKELPKV